jgi:hypothetical protein
MPDVLLQPLLFANLLTTCFESSQADEDYAKKALAKGLVLNHTDDLMVPINNRLDEDECDATGLDAAVDALSGAVSGKASIDEHPERRRKVG